MGDLLYMPAHRMTEPYLATSLIAKQENLTKRTIQRYISQDLISSRILNGTTCVRRSEVRAVRENKQREMMA